MSEYGSPPWKYTDEGNGNFYIRDSGGNRLIWIGESSLHAPGQNEQHSRLISAAPELLDALEMIMPQALSRGEANVYDRAMWDNAAAVIAKAKGENQ